MCLEASLFYEDGEVIDNYGPKPYLVRYYLLADSRQDIDEKTQYFFDHMRVTAADGSRVDCEFIMEKD